MPTPSDTLLADLARDASLMWRLGVVVGGFDIQQRLATTASSPITDPAVIEATFAADFEAEGAPGRVEVR